MIKGAGTKKDWPSEELYKKYSDAVTTLRKTIDGFKDRIAFDPEKALPTAETGLLLLNLADGVNQAYDAEKQSLGVLDFNDLLIHAKKLLVGPQKNLLRKHWAAHLKLLLVDEFQDTDRLQVELVMALCDNEVARGQAFFRGRFQAIDIPVPRCKSRRVSQSAREDSGRGPPAAFIKLPQPAGDTGFRQCLVWRGVSGLRAFICR